MSAPALGKRQHEGTFPQLSFKIRRQIERTDKATIDRFANFFLPDISDAVGRLYTMTSEIKPLYQGVPRMQGAAVTVRVPRGDNAAVKAALQLVEPGDILVVDAQAFTGWCAGGFGMLVPAIRDRGLQGLVVNGAYRDVTQFRSAGVGLFGIAVGTGTGPKVGPGEINVPVSCGGVIVNAGDLVVADEEGVVVVPRLEAARIADYLDSRATRISPDEYSDDDARGSEAAQQAYFEELFAAKGGTWLDGAPS